MNSATRALAIILFSFKNYFSSEATIRNASSFSNIRIVLIGDSVERCAVEDWCRKYNGTLMNDYASLDFIDSSMTLDKLLKPYNQRRKAWEIRLCDASLSKNIIMATVCNKFGVKPQPPWHRPLMTSASLTIANFTGFQVSDIFRVGIKPALDILTKAMGGPSHGIMLNSAFWDLSHPDPENRRRLNRADWLQSWAKNLTSLMSVVKNHYRNADTSYFAWRKASKPTVDASHWNTLYAHELLVDMNILSEEVARNQSFDVLDFYKVVLRDHLHPAPVSTIPLCDRFIRNTLKVLKTKDLITPPIT